MCVCVCNVSKEGSLGKLHTDISEAKRFYN